MDLRPCSRNFASADLRVYICSLKIRKQTLKEVILIAKRRSVALNYKNLVISVIKENYFYLFLGFLLVVVIAILISFWFVKSNKSIVSDKETKAKTQAAISRDYTVKAGDNLWNIAELAYGSGFNAVDIAKINNLVNPDLITIGQKLVLPVVQARTPTSTNLVKTQTEKITFSGNNYLVKEGDYLWKIAIEAYGDGYAWTKIAKVNNLTNPDLIYPKSVLTIPR